MSAQEQCRGWGPHLISTCFCLNKKKKKPPNVTSKVKCSVITLEGRLTITNLSFSNKYAAVASQRGEKDLHVNPRGSKGFMANSHLVIGCADSITAEWG